MFKYHKNGTTICKAIILIFIFVNLNKQYLYHSLLSDTSHKLMYRIDHIFCKSTSDLRNSHCNYKNHFQYIIWSKSDVHHYREIHAFTESPSPIFWPHLGRKIFSFHDFEINPEGVVLLCSRSGASVSRGQKQQIYRLCVQTMSLLSQEESTFVHSRTSLFKV